MFDNITSCSSVAMSADKDMSGDFSVRLFTFSKELLEEVSVGLVSGLRIPAPNTFLDLYGKRRRIYESRKG
jgi:hypothetical protein